MRLPLPTLALLGALLAAAALPARANDLPSAQRLWLAGQKLSLIHI